MTIIQRLKAIDSIINTLILLLITIDDKKSNVYIYIFYLKHSIYNKSSTDDFYCKLHEDIKDKHQLSVPSFFFFEN